MRGKDKDASALAPAAICRKPLRGSFMTLPDELECLRKCRWHLRTKYRRIARPPKTESAAAVSLSHRKPKGEPDQGAHTTRLQSRAILRWHGHADAAHPLAPLRPRAERPRGRRAAEQRDELAAFHCPVSPVPPTGRIAHLSTAGDCCAAAASDVVGAFRRKCISEF